MTTAAQPAGAGGENRPTSSSLADVIDTILDKGLVIDAYVQASLVGIQLLTIDARIVVASVDTYLKFADAVNRIDLTEQQRPGVPELMQDVTREGAKQKTKGAGEGALEAAGDTLSGLVEGITDRERRPSRGGRRDGR